MSDDDEWLETGEEDDGGGDANEVIPSKANRHLKGLEFNKTQMGHVLGVVPQTMNRLLKEGCPVISRGTRTSGWRFNSAEVIDWLRKRDVNLATGSDDALVYDAAKARDKAASARAREIKNAKDEGLLSDTALFVSFLGNTFGVIRSRFLNVPTQVNGLTPDQKEELVVAIHDAFADVSGDKLSDWLDENEALDFESESDSEGEAAVD